MKFQIKARWSDEIKFEGEFTSRRECILAALKSGSDLRDSDLRDSDLRGSDLSGSDLRGSNLSGSDLRDSDLRDSDLSGSDLSGSDLSGSDLKGSDLRGSDLSGSDLRDSDLRGSNLKGSDLKGSDLSGSDLRGSDLREIRADFLAEVIRLPNELEFLRQAIIDGKIDGSTYSGECACLAGTIAHAKGIKDYNGEPITNGLVFKADSSSPRERFFMAIRKGDTPETSSVSKIVLDWTDEAIAIRDNIRNLSGVNFKGADITGANLTAPGKPDGLGGFTKKKDK